MPSPRFPIPQGTLDMLILQILSLEPAHGYGIAQRLEQISRAVVQVNQGSLYPALHRLQQKGWLRAEWKESETGREAKFYALTPSGRRQLAIEKNSWARLSDAVKLIFGEGSRSSGSSMGSAAGPSSAASTANSNITSNGASLTTPPPASQRPRLAAARPPSSA